MDANTRKEPGSAVTAVHRIGVLDMGSNTIKLLVAEPVADPRPGLKVIEMAIEECRVSRGIGAIGPLVLEENSMAAAVDAIDRLRKVAEKRGAGKLLAVATSAVRDAANRQDFVERVRSSTGVVLRVLSGEEEAKASACGLAYDSQLKMGNNILHFDIGGGSLECNRIVDGRHVSGISLPLGAVRVTEQWIQDPFQPIPEDELFRIRAHTADHLHRSGIGGSAGMEVVFTGGSVTIARAIIAAKEEREDSTGVLSAIQLESLLKALSERSYAERVGIPGLPPNRADVVPAAIAVVLEVLKVLGVDYLLHSRYGLRHGLAVQYFFGCPFAEALPFR
ncbi:MAG: hypothetical protein JW706_08150 [Opitutales bacterium]|nr:hypothetical protein [Opitutales bacterium]